METKLGRPSQVGAVRRDWSRIKRDWVCIKAEASVVINSGICSTLIEI